MPAIPERTSEPASASAAPATSGSTSKPPGPGQSPPPIPDHQLLRCIGRGSYGEVWLARNIMGAFRAVKIVHRATFDSDRPYNREFEGLKKFEPISRSHESQVDILHVGRNDEAGYFYHVMELADDQRTGQQIAPEQYEPKTLRSELKARGRLGVEECLRIGLALTTALEHLHKHGLIHRDIKPANIIFVDGLPKLADIGLVATQDATCSFVGTEGYMPPEGPGTPQGDLYSLGKVLYEASTGKDRREFPELPTQSPLPEEEKGLIELNAVVLKACKPDFGQRYASALKMHEDLLLLVAGKSVRRTQALERRLTLVTRFGLGAAAVLVLGAFPYYLAIKEARSARLAAVREAQQRQQAQTEAARRELYARFLEEMLTSVRPSVALGRDTALLREILDHTAERVSKELTNQSEVQAELYDTLGKTYYDLGLTTKALEMEQEAVRLLKLVPGPERPVLASAMTHLGGFLWGADQLSEAERIGREALAMKLRLLGKDHTETATSYDEVALALWSQAKLEEAESAEREALRIRTNAWGGKHEAVARSLSNLAGILGDKGELAEAEAKFEAALLLFRELMPIAHPWVATAANNLGCVLLQKGDLAHAKALLSEALNIRQKVLGPDHKEIAYSLTQLAYVLEDEGRLDEAKTNLDLALVMEERLARGDSPYVVESLDCLGVVLGKQGRLAEAESTFREELALRQRRHEAESSGIAALLDHRALLLATSGRLDGALDMIQDALSIELASQAREPLSLVPLRSHLAWVQERLGQSVAPCARWSKLRTAARLHGTFGARSWVKSNYDLADLLQAQGEFSPAEALLKEAAKFLECDFEGESSLRQRGLQRLIALYEVWDKAAPNTGKSAEAAGCRKYLEELEKARPSLSR